jgi:hypothetical protein
MIKTFLKTIAVISLFVLLWALNSIRPFDDVLGCYRSIEDQICLIDNDNYQQLSKKGIIKHSGKYKNLKYKAPEGEFTALIFYEYLIIEDTTVKEVLVQPISDFLDGEHFYIRDYLIPNSPPLKYTKISTGNGTPRP